MIKSKFLKAATITPVFTNWEKSFVSGPKSTLFKVEHRLASDPTELITHVKFKDDAEGPPGHIHGGATAGLIDEVMGVLVWNQNYPCITQRLNLKYLKPVPLKEDAYLVTTITGIAEKKIDVSCTIFNNEQVALVQATAVFHRLTPEQLNKFSSILKKE